LRFEVTMTSALQRTADVGVIRVKGHHDLESLPGNFSRIVHDYTDSQRDLLYGKLLWKKDWFEAYSTFLDSRPF
jgi:hypothetical protein